VRTVLGIESSCDETGVAVAAVHDDGRAELLADVVASSMSEHARFGGVVPEIASRAHLEALVPTVRAALAEAGVARPDAVATTIGPGLSGALLVGSSGAKAYAAAWGVPFYAVNHLVGHVAVAGFDGGPLRECVALLVSGGHTQVLHVAGLGNYERWGTTIDDALGEAFDKTAKLLSLPYPGGPSVEKAAASGDATRFAFPRPMKGEARLDFSFSGLKTAVRKAATELAPLSQQDVCDICASFQRAVTDTLAGRVGRSLERFRAEHPEIVKPNLVVAGGVAANQAIRRALDALCAGGNFNLIAPPLELCGDNAAMIAWVGLEKHEAGMLDEGALSFSPRSRWPLDQSSAPALGAGKRGAKA